MVSVRSFLCDIAYYSDFQNSVPKPDSRSRATPPTGWFAGCLSNLI
ncbi:hypothetical protein D3OALGA1CA_2774 [Olavius algarvensis associated proteobacterium Delta 3]|nr:hypothetical protein D3OALGB2SA_793 [Olavius algarvensis associated proteobacterium Delta 3]CAB5124081.1 hypothetical protein D3OALGA1CA_2774 [Olavius algarvensis associated proteobacterium Delta 3]